MPWTYVISDFNREEIVGAFYEIKMRNTNQKRFRVEKEIKKKTIDYISYGKVMLILLIVGFTQKDAV